MSEFQKPLKYMAIKSLLLGAIVALSACAATPVTRGSSDPHELHNRAVHRENIQLDQAVVRPVAQLYGAVLPDPVEQSVSNFASNISLPGLMVNNLLQGDMKGFGQNTTRFVMNTIFGIGGLFDPASDAGVFEDDTDFGETLYVWGAPEGDFIMLPLLGPTTERHMFGRVVDIFTNPVTAVLKKPESRAPTIAKIGSRLSDRNKYSDTFDSILTGSADSYAQTKLIYLQKRRFQLGVTENVVDEDPYEDPYADQFSEDPYDQ